MRKVAALLWSGISALAGALGAGPSVPPFSFPRLAQAQRWATEDPGIGIVAGALGVWKGLRARSGWAILLGLVGIALGARRLKGRDAANRVMANALRDGLGVGWQRAIPPETHLAFGQMSRADLWGPLRRLPLDGSREARDVVFATPDGCPLDLDVYEPPTLASEANPSPQANPSLNPSPQAGRDLRHPAVIVVAGGERGAAAHTLRCRWLAAQGYVVFAIDYRRAALWPAPLADVKCAIRWVKLNATRYRVDPARVALMGRWLGGHLALMAAYTANDATVPASCFGNDSVDDEVAAVIANGAPTDLRPGRGVLGIVVAQLMGGPADEMPAAYAQASPVTHARSGLPPTLLIHGQRDAVVLPTHAEWLANELRAAGGTVVLLRVPGARHGADSFVTGVTAPMIQYDVDRFLAWALRRDGQGS